MWVSTTQHTGNALIEHVNTLSPKIKRLVLLPAEMCNYRCNFCHIWGDTGWARKEPSKAMREQLDVSVLKRFIEELHSVNKGFAVTLSGGESLLYKDVVELGEFLRHKKVPLHLLTNASTLHRHIDFVIDNVMGLMVSIDGPEAEHDAIRGKGSFQKICDNLEMLMAEKKKRKKLFPFIQIQMTVTPGNYQSIKDFMPALRKRFAKSKIVLHDSTSNPWLKKRDMNVNFQLLYYTDQAHGLEYVEQMKELGCGQANGWKGFLEDDHIDIDTKRLTEDLQSIWKEEGVDYSKYINVHDYFSDINENFGRTRCVAPWYELTIRRTGEVYPCVDLPDYSLGNINEESFSEIWEGERLKKFREYYKKNGLAMCNRCTRIWADSDSFDGLW